MPTSTFANDRDSPQSWVPKSSPSPQGQDATSIAHSWGWGRMQAIRQKQTQTRQKQAGQADKADRQPHLQEPASSTSVWGTIARGTEKGTAGAGARGAERKRKRESPSGPPPTSATARRCSPSLPTQPHNHPSIHPLIHPSVHACIHRPSLTEGWVGAAPSKGAAGDARWDASCSVFSCSRRTV